MLRRSMQEQEIKMAFELEKCLSRWGNSLYFMILISHYIPTLVTLYISSKDILNQDKLFSYLVHTACVVLHKR